MYPYTTNVAPCAIILSPSRDPNVAPLYLLRTSQPEMGRSGTQKYFTVLLSECPHERHSYMR
jgi:hypothetical protein